MGGGTIRSWEMMRVGLVWGGGGGVVILTLSMKINPFLFCL